MNNMEVKVLKCGVNMWICLCFSKSENLLIMLLIKVWTLFLKVSKWILCVKYKQNGSFLNLHCTKLFNIKYNFS